MHVQLSFVSLDRYGPPGSPLMGVVLFVDDLNMPEADKFGTQRVLELMRQHIDYGYWHNPDKVRLLVFVWFGGERGLLVTLDLTALRIAVVGDKGMCFELSYRWHSISLLGANTFAR